MLLGVWKNIEELENSINLDELQAVLEAGREKEQRHNRFMAAINGIDLDKENKNNAQAKFDEVQRRVEAQLTGKSEKAIELDVFGLDIEIEE